MEEEEDNERKKNIRLNIAKDQLHVEKSERHTMLNPQWMGVTMLFTEKLLENKLCVCACMHMDMCEIRSQRWCVVSSSTMLYLNY